MVERQIAPSYATLRRFGIGGRVGARWAVASMGAAGALLMVTIGVALPRARLIR